MNELANQVREIPKVEFHVHLDGSLRPGTIFSLAKEIGYPIEFTDERDLQAWVHARKREDQRVSLRVFDWINQFLQTRESLVRVAYELGEDLAAHNVRYAEVRYCPALHTEEGLTPLDVQTAVWEGLRMADGDFGIATGVIICFVRLRPRGLEEAQELARFAAESRNLGVVGVDLAGAEAYDPPENYREAFAIAKNSGLGVTIHAGEPNPEAVKNIRTSLEMGADRIGHATFLYQDLGLMAEVRDRGILLEICMGANWGKGTVPSYAEHPALIYHNAGIPIAFCTDNLLVSGKESHPPTPTGERLHAISDLGLSLDQIRRIEKKARHWAFR